MRKIGQSPWVPGTTCRAHAVIWEHENKKMQFATGFYSAFGGAHPMPIINNTIIMNKNMIINVNNINVVKMKLNCSG